MEEDIKDPFFLINEDIARARDKIKKEMAPRIGLYTFDVFFQNLRLKHFNDNRQIKQLILLLAADFFWETFFSSSANNKADKITKGFKEFPNEIQELIQMSKKYSIDKARSGIMRAIYLLHNINPYKEQNIARSLEYSIFELGNLSVYFSSVKNIHDIEMRWPITDKRYEDWSFEEKNAYSLFNPPLGCPEIINQAQNALKTLKIFNEGERVDFMDIFILWRGKFEAFKNELRTRKKDHNLIIKTIIDGRGGYEWKLDEEDRLPHRTDAYKCNEVRAWLLTKGINTNIENIELTMPPQYLPSVQGDSVSIFNSINKRGKKVVKTIEDAFAEAVEKEHEEDFRRLLKESKKILEKINKSEKKRKS